MRRGGASPIEVRRVVDGDVDRVREVRLAALADAPEAFSASLEDEAASPLSDWHELVAQSDAARTGAVFLALDAGRPVGMCGIYIPDEPVATGIVWGMWVSAEVRGRGVGPMLLDQLRRWAIERRLEALELEVIEEAAAARALYERYGFAQVGDAISLTKDPRRSKAVMRLALARPDVLPHVPEVGAEGVAGRRKPHPPRSGKWP